MYVSRCDLRCKEAKPKPANVASYTAKTQVIQRGRSESEEIMLMAGAKCSAEVDEMSHSAVRTISTNEGGLRELASGHS